MREQVLAKKMVKGKEAQMQKLMQNFTAGQGRMLTASLFATWKDEVRARAENSVLEHRE